MFCFQKGTKAPQAAGCIHSDFENGFIMAEVVKFDDLKEAGSENAAKVIFVYFCFHSQIIIAEVLKLEDLKAQGSLNAAKFLLLLCALLVIFIPFNVIAFCLIS